MKTLTKLSLITATLAVVGAGAASADDTQLRNRLDSQRQDAERTQQSTTVAVYVNHRGVNQRAASLDQQSEPRFELRTNSKGQPYGIFVPAK